MPEQALQLRFWGVRGSVAVPGPSTLRYGGNTACVEVRSGREVIILDAGTGIRELGRKLSSPSQPRGLRVWILITHTHWDHIQGFPFFAPAYQARRQVRILGRPGSHARLRRTIAAAVESPFFPVPLRRMPGTITFGQLRSRTFAIGHVRGSTAPLNHPGGGVAFRLETPGASLAYVPDHELPLPQGPRRAAAATPSARSMESLIRGVDVLIHDAQYTRREYASRKGWGHSSVEDTVAAAATADVRKLILFHHDPDRDDDAVDQLLASARKLARRLNPSLVVEAAREGAELTLHRERPPAPSRA